MQHYLYIYCLCCVILNSVSLCFNSALETLDVDKVYVLGGLVDESIQKVWHADNEQIKTVQLSILFTLEYTPPPFISLH